MNYRRYLANRTALAMAAAAALSVAAPHVAAIGLGRLTVSSALGEGLRADVDVTGLTPEEAATLSVQIASPEAYRAAGVDYNSVLAGARVVLMKRSDGRPFLRITSDRAVQEPYLDAILEVNSSSGRLRREYTMLFDPPGARVAAAAAPVATTVAAAPPAAPAQAAAVPAPRPAPAPAPRVSIAPGASRYEVQDGDSLSRIAASTRQHGVSLDQMIAALYRANPDAFISRNINKLKAGAVIAIPGAEDAKSMSTAEAKQLIVAQSVDFGAYRARLAEAAPAAPAEAPARAAQGKVQAAVEDRTQAAAPSPDKLRLSGGAVSASAPPAAPAAQPNVEQLEAKIAELTRSIEELKREQQAQAVATVAPAPAVPAPATQAPASATAVSPPAAPTPAPAQASAPATPSLGAPAKVSPPPVAPPPEPGWIETIGESPFLWPGVGVLAVLVAGGVAWRMRGRWSKSTSETSFLESKIQPDSFFGASGGQRVDTREAGQASSSMGYSLSQLDAIGDVDPVAEADVYLAYGRDLQAEEILKEALRANPDRMAIRSKLLEVYAKRRDSRGFELLATQVYGQTSGTGPDWQKAQELGRQIDPDNPLYQPGGKPAEIHVHDRVVTEPLDATTLPQSTFPSSSPGALTEPGSMPKAESTLDLDLDLDLSEPSADAMAHTQPLASTPARESVDPTTLVDFDLQPTPSTVRIDQPTQRLPAREERDSLRLDLEPSPEVPLARSGAADATIDFGEFSLSGPGPRTIADAAPTTPNDIAEFPTTESDPLARKFELAEEFRQIGDLEGARDLLEEVVARAGGALKARAKAMLDDLS